MKIEWNRLNATEWNGLLPSDAAALQQSWRYGESLRILGRPVHRAQIVDQQGPVALAQLLCRPFGRFVNLVLQSRGPIWLRPTDQRECHELLRKSLPDRGFQLILTTPETPQGATLPLISPGFMAELTLHNNCDVMRAGLRGKWRNRLVRAENSGIRVTRETNAMTFDWLLGRDQVQQHARGYRALPVSFLKAWRACGAAPAVYVARSNKQVLAAMMFLDHAPGVTYQIGWSSSQGRMLNAHNLILWRAICDYAKLGCKRMDLGSVDTVNSAGLARFKLGTGARLRLLESTGLMWPRLSIAKPEIHAMVESCSGSIYNK